MEESNIIGGSNIFYFESDNPWHSPQFVAQITNSFLLRQIKKRYEVDKAICRLSQIQMAITMTEIRCAYSEDDPCWGYVNGVGNRCKCVKTQCHHFKKCNPYYHSGEDNLWTMSEETKSLYGYPEKQKKYYLVDLVSEEEMKRYITDPKGEGPVFMAIPDESIIVSDKEERKQVIIGWIETRFGTESDYQISPIYGFLDEEENLGKYNSNRFVGTGLSNIDKGEKAYSSVGRKESSKKKGKKDTLELSLIDNAKRGIVQFPSKIKDTYSLIQLIEIIIRGDLFDKYISVVLSNPAELAYVSSMFMESNIAYSIGSRKKNTNIVLVVFNPDSDSCWVESEIVILSRIFVEQEADSLSKKLWSCIENIDMAYMLLIERKDFFCFETDSNLRRWGCSYLSEVTHLVILPEDLDIPEYSGEDTKIFLLRDGTRYLIYKDTDNIQIGKSTEQLYYSLMELKENDKIPDFPRLIVGLVIIDDGCKFDIKGIGHMKFDQY